MLGRLVIGLGAFVFGWAVGYTAGTYSGEVWVPRRKGTYS